MNIQIKLIQADNHLIDKTNKELTKLGSSVIDVEVHRDDTLSGGGYSIIKYTPDPVTMRKLLNEQRK